MKIVVCDNEEYICRDLVHRLHTYYKSMDVLILSVLSGEELLKLMRREPEGWFCVFLDIEMNGISGMETARKIREQNPEIPVIFLTSHMEYALEGYEVHAFRFLSKPLQQEKLEEALKAAEHCGQWQEVLRVSTGKQEVLIKWKDILYLKSENVYVRIVTKEEAWLIRGKLKEFLKRLPELFFCQMHRSYIVNLSYVHAYDGKNVVLEDGEILPVSGRKKEMFQSRIAEYLRKK